MKFVKGISLYFIYPFSMLVIGFYVGVKSMHFFYPGDSGQWMQEQNVQEPVRIEAEDYSMAEKKEVTPPMPDQESKQDEETRQNAENGQNVEIWRDNESWHDVGSWQDEAEEVSVSMETLSVDTQYVLEETDILNGTVVETVWKLPDKYVGMNREQFLDAMSSYESFPPLAEMERGFVNLEVLSFSRERVVVQMNYQYLQPSTSFYLAVSNNEVVAYLEDMETVYIYTGIMLDSLPEDVQMEIMQMLWIEDEETLYNFLEAYSS